MELFEKFLSLLEAKTNTIVVFDIDDTLFFSDSKIRYRINGGEWKSVTTEEWAEIKNTLDPENTEYDFSDFTATKKIFLSMMTAKPNVPVLQKLDKAVKAGDKIGILTARANQDAIAKSMSTFLKWRSKDNMFKSLPKDIFNKKYIYAVGDPKTRKYLIDEYEIDESVSSSELKGIVLQKIFGDEYGFENIYFLDDDKDNVDFIKKLNDLRIKPILIL